MCLWLLLKKVFKGRECWKVYLCPFMFTHAPVRSIRERKNFCPLIIIIIIIFITLANGQGLKKLRFKCRGQKSIILSFAWSTRIFILCLPWNLPLKRNGFHWAFLVKVTGVTETSVLSMSSLLAFEEVQM